jgi:hypothetical protein
MVESGTAAYGLLQDDFGRSFITPLGSYAPIAAMQVRDTGDRKQSRPSRTTRVAGRLLTVL